MEYFLFNLLISLFYFKEQTRKENTNFLKLARPPTWAKLFLFIFS